MKNKTITTVAATLALMTLASIAFADTSVGADVSTQSTISDTVSANASARVKANVEARQATRATNQATKMQAVQAKGDAALDARIAKLNALLVRINAMKNVSASGKTTFAATINAEITSLTALKNTIASDTASSTLKADAQSITKDYRIYALVVPQLNILAAADRVNTIVGLMTTLSAKLSSRLSGATVADVATLQASLTDMNAKIADASVQANAATSIVANLAPDQGSTATLQTNTAALKDARTKIQAAVKDLQAARADAETIAKALKGSKTSTALSASTTISQ